MDFANCGQATASRRVIGIAPVSMEKLLRRLRMSACPRTMMPAEVACLNPRMGYIQAWFQMPVVSLHGQHGAEGWG